MSQDEFTKLFKYMQKEFGYVRKEFEIVHKETADIRLDIAELQGNLKDYHQELIMLARKVDRMERWIHEIAEKTGVKLSYK